MMATSLPSMGRGEPPSSMVKLDRATPWPLIAIILAVVLIPLNSTMIAVGLEPISRALGVSEPSVVWVVTAYLVVMAALQPIAGKLGDLFGRRRLLLLGLVIFVGSSVAAALLPNLDALVFFRSAQALGGALIVPSAMGLLRQLYQGQELRRRLGTVGLVQGLGAAVGPLVGAFLIHLGGWTYMFWINVPVVALAFIVAVRRLPADGPRGRRSVDYWGALSLAGFLTLFAVSVPHHVGAFSAREAVYVALAVLCFGVFLWAEARASDPVIRFAIFRRPPLVSANLAILASNFFMYATLLFMPVYLAHHHASTTTTGLLLFAFSFAMSLMSYLGGRVGRVLGPRRVVLLAFGLDLVVVLWYLGLGHFSAMAYVLAGLIVAGVGAGIGTVTMQATALEAAPADMAGTVSGIYSTFRYIGSITASALVSLMVISVDAHALILTVAALLGFFALSGFPVRLVDTPVSTPRAAGG